MRFKTEEITTGKDVHYRIYRRTFLIFWVPLKHSDGGDPTSGTLFYYATEFPTLEEAQQAIPAWYKLLFPKKVVTTKRSVEEHIYNVR